MSVKFSQVHKVDYLSVTCLAEEKLLQGMLATSIDKISFYNKKNGCLSPEETKETLLTAEPGQQAIGIRLSIPSKGCGGLSYKLTRVYQNNYSDLDEMLELPNGAVLFIDPVKSFMLFGLILDYKETPLEYGFLFINPNEKGRCGCGESFYVKEI